MVLACGAVCQPTEIQREIESFPSSTCTVRVATDVGEGFLKSPGNPMGNGVLVSELVGAELAAWFGLSVPPFALVRQCDIDIVMQKNGARMKPPMFFSLAVDGEPHAGDTFLKRALHPEDVAKLVVFDTWVRNWDRYEDNLLYVAVPGRRPRYRMVPIDQGECFLGPEGGTNFPVDNWPDDQTNDPDVYCNLRDDFEPYLTAGHVAAALSRLAQLDHDFVDEVVRSAPAEWGLGAHAATSLCDFICRRADYVVKTVSTKLVKAPEIPGL